MATWTPLSRLSLIRFSQQAWQRLSANDVTGHAAEMSYYFVLSIFPFLIFLGALLGTLPLTDTWNSILKWIVLYFPRESQETVFAIVLNLTEGQKGLLSLGFLGTAWAASGGFLSLMEALNAVYKVEETRSFPSRLGLALLMVFVLSLLLVMAFGLLTAGDHFDHWLGSHGAGIISAPALWRVTRWMTSILLLGVGMGVLDRTLPNSRRPWRASMPGVAFTVLTWLLATTVFNVYTHYLGAFNTTYGVLGVFITLMVWIYLSCLIILTGAEINFELDKRWAETTRTKGFVAAPFEPR